MARQLMTGYWSWFSTGQRMPRRLGRRSAAATCWMKAAFLPTVSIHAVHIDLRQQMANTTPADHRRAHVQQRQTLASSSGQAVHMPQQGGHGGLGCRAGDASASPRDHAPTSGL